MPKIESTEEVVDERDLIAKKLPSDLFHVHDKEI